jgi:hypothetical protein
VLDRVNRRYRFSMKKPLRSSTRGASFHTKHASNANVDRVVSLDANSFLAHWSQSFTVIHFVTEGHQSVLIKHYSYNFFLIYCQFHDSFSFPQRLNKWILLAAGIPLHILTTQETWRLRLVVFRLQSVSAVNAINPLVAFY